MELRSLRYFLEVARRGNFTAAATALNLTQPTLSRQMQELEAELGVALLVRGKRRTSLTAAGTYLAERAAEILELAARTRDSLAASGHAIVGEVAIAAGETRAMDLVAAAIRKTRRKARGIRFHLFSGNAEAVSERLERGLADFGIFIGPANLENFDYVGLPLEDTWGLLLRADDELSGRAAITPADLAGRPLICSAQTMADNGLGGWLGHEVTALDIVATYTLLYNASLLVRAGVGAAVCINGIVDAQAASGLCFRPFSPALPGSLTLAWKKGRMFSAAATVFREALMEEIARGAPGAAVPGEGAEGARP